LLGIIGVASTVMAGAGLASVKPGWTESHAEARVVATVRFHPPGAAEDIQTLRDQIANAKEELSYAKQQHDPSGVVAANEALGSAESQLSDLVRGYPATHATCIGEGAAAGGKSRTFSRFDCIVAISDEPNDFTATEHVVITVRDASRMYYRWA
jgi:hypothetical protein